MKLTNNFNNEGKSASPWLILIFIALSLVGFIDASYLAIKSVLNGAVKCYIFSGCDIVLNSSYSHVFSIPISFFGAFFYLAVFLLSIRYLETKNNKILFFLRYLFIAAALFTAYLLILQFFVLKAVCFYCLASAVDSLALFILGFFFLSD